ncbi:hypothetical protein ACCS62_28465 [Rhizobium ruizarguesonis]
MSTIDKFLDGAVPTDRLDLARVNIAGGDKLPFYCAQMRSFWREGKPDTSLTVSETFGLRSVLVDSEPREIEVAIGRISHNAPVLLRLYPRPRTYGQGVKGEPSNRLFLWHPKKIINAEIVASSAASDLLANPLSAWPNTTEKNARVPLMRLVDGRANVVISLADSTKTFFSFDQSAKTIFGGFHIDSGPRLEARLVPDGVEFDGSILDPTRDFSGGAADSRIKGTFRLECNTNGPTPQYLLRLVRADEVEISKTEARISEALSELLGASAPVAIRFDKRPVVPPLSWELAISGQSLKLVPSSGGSTDFEMLIGTDAIDVRVRTMGLSDEESGLANILARRIAWKRNTGPEIELDIAAGGDLPGTGSFDISFQADSGKWTAEIGDIEDQAFSAPVDTIAERLLPIYQAGGGIGLDAESAPYLFMPVHEGWLQLAIGAATHRSEKTIDVTRKSAMSGRIFVVHENTNFSLVLDDAQALLLQIVWTKKRGGKGATKPGVTSLRLSAGGPVGQLLGVLYVAESSPNAAEALPSLRGGPAATRDLPLWFGVPPQKPEISGTFTWQRSTGDLQAKITVPAPAIPDNPAALAWLPAGPSPFITNIPLTRALPSTPEPSATRGLVPRKIAEAATITLDLKADTCVPTVSAVSEWFSRPGGDDAFDLLLPTLAGVEFSAGSNDPSKGLDQAKLRFDLPILDELFAWSDPPKQAGSNRNTVPTNLPTALEPLRLEKIWSSYLNKIALTRTQAADLSKWVAVGKTEPVEVGALVEPLIWDVDLTIDGSAPDAWGSYRLGLTDYRLDSAAEGIGGKDRVGFAINGSKITPDGDKFTVSGNAANLFPFQWEGGQAGLVWDSRGFGLAQRASEGLRAAEQISAANIASKKPQALLLRTLEDVLEIEVINSHADDWSFEESLCFFARDLPTKDDVFDYSDNPIENAFGMNGQAFDAGAFPTSLHEWRFFEKPDELNIEPAPKSYDVRWGPFLFKPLRLLSVAFDGNEATEISVLGSMRLSPNDDGSSGSALEIGPFEEDDVYLRADLFALNLVRAHAIWTYTWVGKQVDVSADPLSFTNRTDATITIDVDLKNAEGFSTTGQEFVELQFEKDVAATIALDITSLKSRVELRLFGTDYRLEGTVTKQPKGFSLNLPIAAQTAAGETGAVLHPASASITIDGNDRLLALTGHLEIYTRRNNPNGSDLIASIGSKVPSWLGITIPKEPVLVDHATGAIKWETRWNATQFSLPFYFEARNADLSAAVAFVADVKPGAKKLGSIEIGAAWARLSVIGTDPSDQQLDHELLASKGGTRDHHLVITWSRNLQSSIAWPENQIVQSDGSQLPADWLDPAKADLTQRSRDISILGDAGARLTHRATINLRRHQTDADSLAVVGSIVTVKRPVRLLAIIDHVLIADAGSHSETTRAHWTTVDHVVLTSRVLMARECDALTFVPLPVGTKYRGDTTNMRSSGIASFSLALAGFHDRALADLWWKGNDEQLVIIGGAAVQFADPNDIDKSFFTVFPWIDIRPAKGGHLDVLNSDAGNFLVAAADLWPASPMASGAMSTRVIGKQAFAEAIEDQLNADRMSSGEPSKIIAVEQAYFEGKKPAEIPIRAAPFFLRAMMAVSGRLTCDVAGPAQWDATTIEAGRFSTVGKSIVPPSFSAIRLKVKLDDEPIFADPEQVLAKADLIVLSQGKATRLVAFRNIALGKGGDLPDRASRDELSELATDLDADAILALRVAQAPANLPDYAWRSITKKFGKLAEGKVLTAADKDVGASAALGWPSDVVIKNLFLLSPDLGEELPVLGHEAGFAARFQRFGWPAYAPAQKGDEKFERPGSAEALYMSFANQIIYDRGDTGGFTFDGPAARHLMPAPVRRRAPIWENTQAILNDVLQPAGEAAPILPPSIERGTIGRRPGVMEAVVASMTLPADRPGFDPENDYFGRPANSGPVVAHQLRNPRSPVLPRDEVPKDGRTEEEQSAQMQAVTLRLRRRTYVSLADGDYTLGKLDLFYFHEGAADIVRFETGGSRHDRITIIAPEDTSLQPGWNGKLSLKVEVGTLKPISSVDGPIVRIRAHVEIGQAVFPADLDGEPENPFVLDTDIPPRLITVAVRDPSGASLALRGSTADTPIRVVLDIAPFGGNETNTQLPMSPRWQVCLPLLLDPGARRVVPVMSRMIIFGDPSYDRQLASQTASAQRNLSGGADRLFRISADRKAYDLEQTLYFAGGLIEKETGTFDKNGSPASFALQFQRQPPRAPNGDQPPPELLIYDRTAPDAEGYITVDCNQPYEVSLKRLLSATNRGGLSPLQPGDKLQLSAVVGSDVLQPVTVDIVAEPVIAPPPSVFTIIETSSDRTLARSILHASGPLPQKIEFPNLLIDLAIGHVARRALFVWRDVAVGTKRNGSCLDLIKFDRSGGAQLPDEPVAGV